MAAASDFCDKCFEALRHDGEERGKWEDIPGGHKAYVATPADAQAKEGIAVLFLAGECAPPYNDEELISRYSRYLRTTIHQQPPDCRFVC